MSKIEIKKIILIEIIKKISKIKKVSIFKLLKTENKTIFIK